MTVSSTNRVAGPFTGAGTTATFPFTFKVFLASDLYVVTLNLATGSIALLALTTDYTVALNADQDSSPGGSITLTAGNLATGLTLMMTTAIAELQGLDLTNGGGFYPDVINAALDLLTLLVQQLAVQVSRSVQAPLFDVGTNMTLPPAAERAGKLLMFDSNGNPSLISLAPGSAVPGAQTATGVVNGVNLVFTFAASAEATPVPMVFAGGVFQTPGEDYNLPLVSLGGGVWQITFVNAPGEGPITVALFA
jgi:hypothetical protein